MKKGIFKTAAWPGSAGVRLYCLGIAVICILTALQLPDAKYRKEFGLEEMSCLYGEEFVVDEKLQKYPGGGVFQRTVLFSG